MRIHLDRPLTESIEECLYRFVSELSDDEYRNVLLVATILNLPSPSIHVVIPAARDTAKEREAARILGEYSLSHDVFGEDSGLAHRLWEIVEPSSTPHDEPSTDPPPVGHCYFLRQLQTFRGETISLTSVVLTQLPGRGRLVPLQLRRLSEETAFVVALSDRTWSTREILARSFSARAISFAMSTIAAITGARSALLWKFVERDDCYESVSNEEATYRVPIEGVETGEGVQGIIGMARPERDLVIFDERDHLNNVPATAMAWAPHDPAYMKQLEVSVCVAWPVVVDGELLGAISIYSDSLLRLEYGNATRRLCSQAAHEYLRHELDSDSLEAIESAYEEELSRSAAGAIATDFIHDFIRTFELVDGVLKSIKSADGGSDSRQGQMVQLQEAKQSVRFLTALTKGLRTASRGGPRRGRCDVRALLSEYEGFLSAIAVRDNPHANVNIVYVDMPGDPNLLSTRISLPEFSLLRLLMNLIRNAAYWNQYCENQNIVVRVAPGQVAQPAEARHLSIAVVDYGVGIAPGDLERVFERGFTRRPEDGGTGIGLHLVRRIVEEGGGSIRVSSRPNRWTSFTALFPVLS
jgi:signal transduction histidine kinase